MAKNQVQRGDVIDYPAGGTIVSGAVVPMQNIIGVALKDAVAGEVIGVAIEDVWELPKVPGAVFVIGEKLIWDASAGQFDDSAATPAAGDITGAGVAVRAGLNGETTCLVKLTPGNSTRT